MARPRGAPALPATDLTNLHGRLDGLSGRPMADVARATLEAGASLVQTWRELEPLVRQLTAKVQAQVQADTFDERSAARLLALCAGVVQKVGGAAQGMLRACEGQSRLALLLEGGVERTQPRHLTEKQLASVVIEAVKKIAKEQRSCPVCSTTIAAMAEPVQ